MDVCNNYFCYFVVFLKRLARFLGICPEYGVSWNPLLHPLVLNSFLHTNPSALKVPPRTLPPLRPHTFLTPLAPTELQSSPAGFAGRLGPHRTHTWTRRSGRDTGAKTCCCWCADHPRCLIRTVIGANGTRLSGCGYRDLRSGVEALADTGRRSARTGLAAEI